MAGIAGVAVVLSRFVVQDSNHANRPARSIDVHREPRPDQNRRECFGRLQVTPSPVDGPGLLAATAP